MSENNPPDQPASGATDASDPYLAALLEEFEEPTKLAEFEIASRIHALAARQLDFAPSLAWKAEAIAFGFMEQAPKGDGKTNDDFYTPSATWVTADGKTHGNPDVSLVTSDMVQYWQQRCSETNNPLLKARYSGLIWEFGKRVTGEKPNHDVARIHIAALIAIAEQDIAKFETDAVHKLGRALDVACSLNADDLIQASKRAILEYEDRIAVDDMLGLWGFSFDLLIGNKRALLTPGEEAKIITDLEARLKRFGDRKPGNVSDPFRCEAAASRLAEYYRGLGRREDVIRVIRILGEAFNAAMDIAAPLQALSWAEHLHGIYMTYQLEEDADEITRKMREIGPRVRGEMKTISHAIEIPKEEIHALVKKVIGEELGQALEQIAASFIPKRKSVEDMLNSLAKAAPLQAHIPKHITDGEGRLLSVIGPLAEDLDGNVVHQMAQNMAFQSMLLGVVMDEGRKKYQISAESLSGHLSRSPAFLESHKANLLKGLAAYLEGDYSVAAHLLIPQLESGARVILDHAGGAVLKPRRGGGFDLKTLGDILREDAFKEMFNEDFVLYLKVLLTDPRGWNLRNTVMHGTQPDEAFTKVMLDRVVHVLLCFALVQPVSTTS